MVLLTGIEDELAQLAYSGTLTAFGLASLGTLGTWLALSARPANREYRVRDAALLARALAWLLAPIAAALALSSASWASHSPAYMQRAFAIAYFAAGMITAIFVVVFCGLVARFWSR